MRVLHIFHLLVLAALMLCAPNTAVAQTSSSATWVNDNRFRAVFDMYWRTRLLETYAGNRMCSIKEHSSYDDPKSPFRPIQERVLAAQVRLDNFYPKALNTVARPYQMPPLQMNCDDERSAWEVIFAFETSVTALERLLDNLEGKTPSLQKGH